MESVIAKYGFTMLSTKTRWSEEKVGDCLISQVIRLLWDDKTDDALALIESGECNVFYFIKGWIYHTKMKNYEKAAEMYQKCSHDYHPASYNIGVMYQNGQHFEKDIKMAHQLFTRGADAGYSYSILGLRILDHNYPDQKEPIQAREIGIADAQYMSILTEIEKYKKEGNTPTSTKIQMWIKDLEPFLGIDRVDALHTYCKKLLCALDTDRMTDMMIAIVKTAEIHCSINDGQIVATVDGLSIDDKIEFVRLVNQTPELGNLFLEYVSYMLQKQGLNVQPTKITKCVMDGSLLNIKR
jgi:tetratricopeptide (TPR) repeat protein